MNIELHDRRCGWFTAIASRTAVSACGRGIGAAIELQPGGRTSGYALPTLDPDALTHKLLSKDVTAHRHARRARSGRRCGTFDSRGAPKLRRRNGRLGCFRRIGCARWSTPDPPSGNLGVHGAAAPRSKDGINQHSRRERWPSDKRRSGPHPRGPAACHRTPIMRLMMRMPSCLAQQLGVFSRAPTGPRYKHVCHEGGRSLLHSSTAAAVDSAERCAATLRS